MHTQSYFFKEGEAIDHKYTVSSFITSNNYAQTYRVRTTSFETKVLKLFLVNAADELAVLERLDYPNVVKLNGVGEVELNNKTYGYAILDFVDGDSLFERIQRNEHFSRIGSRSVFLSILRGLIYLRRLHPVVYHNRLMPKNVILNLGTNATTPVLANFSFSSGKAIEYTPDELYFVEPEAFKGEVQPNSDLYAAGAIYYYLLHSFPPFAKELNNDAAAQEIPFVDALTQKKREHVVFHDDLYESTQYIITKALHPDPAQRYQCPAEIRKDLYKDPHDPSFRDLLQAIRV